MADLLLRYGFEGYTGTWPTPGTVTPSPDPPDESSDGYPFSSVTNTDGGGLSWYDHLESCRINSGTAHGGTYHLHHGFCEVAGQTDPGLNNQVSGGLDTNVHVGAYSTYPNHDQQNPFVLANERTSPYLFVRFWFRLTGDWGDDQACTQAVPCPGGHGSPNYWTHLLYPGLKFVRFGTSSGYGDTRAPILQLMTGSEDDGGYDPEQGWLFTWSWRNGVFCTAVYATDANDDPCNFNDGNWHCCCIKHRLLNEIEEDPTDEAWVWFDNWNCVGGDSAACFHRADGYHSDIGTGIAMVRFAENFAGHRPSTVMGIDFDDIEIWDGSPTTEELAGTATGAITLGGINVSGAAESPHKWVSGSITLGAVEAEGPSLLAPTDLYCEQQTNPMWVTDLMPEFSAVVSTLGANITEARIQVSAKDDSNFDEPLSWDSGWLDVTDKSAGQRLDDIEYGSG